MTVLTNVSPYYDDFNEDKNFVKVLFKPGVAVQSRELTTAQTILQNQIKSVGNFLFKDGSKVTGPAPTVNLDARTIRLQNLDTQGNSLNIQNLKNTYVTTGASGNASIIGFVEFAFEAGDPNPDDPLSIVISLKKYSSTTNGIIPENTTLYFYTDYTNALLNGSPNYTATTPSDVYKNAITTLTQYSTSAILTNPSQIIEVGDLLIHPGLTKKIYVAEIRSSTELILSEAPGVQLSSENISYVRKATNPTLIVTQDEAVFYKYGYFVKCLQQKIVPDKNVAYPTKLIALISDQQIITSNDDSSLLDPAVGTSNYYATGADRLKVDLTLSVFDLTSEGTADTTEDVIPLLYYNKGQIEFITEVTIDTALERKLAERTYDESGSYVVDPFTITSLASDASNSNMYFSVSAGKAYVGGEQVKTIGPTQITIPKTAKTETKTSFNINTIQGNYVKVTNVKNSIPASQQLNSSSSIFELHTIVNPTDSTTRVGYVAFKNLEYESSAGADTVCKFYFSAYLQEKEVPATWTAWSNKYGIPVNEGQYLAGVIYSSNALWGNYTLADLAPYGATSSYVAVTSTPYYGLYREPDAAGLAAAHEYWAGNGKDIEAVKKRAISVIFPSSPDYTRLRTSSKEYAEVINDSPFYDGLTGVTKIRSIVGVNNSYAVGSSGTYVSPTFYADIDSNGIDYNGDIIISDATLNDKLVYDTSKIYVKSLTNIKTEYNYTITNAIFSSGSYIKTLSAPETFVLGDGTIPASTARRNFILLVKTGATASVPLGINTFETATITISSDATSLTINLNDPTFTGVCDLSIRIQNDNLIPRTKTLVQNAYKELTIDTAEITYSLQKADILDFKGVWPLAGTTFQGNWSPLTTYDYDDSVYSLGSVYKAILPSSNVSIFYSNVWQAVSPVTKSYFVLDNGQTDYFYEQGSLEFIGPTSALPGQSVVVFDYFTHTGNGPVTVESYPISYSKIPTYISVTDSNRYFLRDCIDFRPRRVDGSSASIYEAAIYPASDVTTEADITYYLGRKDRIYVVNSFENYDSPYNKFIVEEGIETANPASSSDKSDVSKLSIAVLEIPPFASTAFDVTITYEDTRRYTMRDIGKINDMTIKLDKAVKLHSIEIAQLKSIVLNEDGDVLLKSGILVESFAGLDVADTESGYLQCVINPVHKNCMPDISGLNVDLSLSDYNDRDVFVLNDLVMPAFTSETVISQTEINSFINVNPGGVNDGRGRAVLSKSNSFSLNLLTLGGILFAGAVAAKTIAAYEVGGLLASGLVNPIFDPIVSAAMQDNLLLTVWEASKAVGANVWTALKDIDIINKVSSMFSDFSFENIVTVIQGGVEYLFGPSMATVAAASAAEATAIQTLLLEGGYKVGSSVISTSSSGLTGWLTGNLKDFGTVGQYAAKAVTAVSAAYASAVAFTTSAITGVAGAIGLNVAAGSFVAGAAAFAAPIIVGAAAVAVVSKVVDWIEDACFITTAMCRHDEKPDDCDELETLRKFRDTYMMETQERIDKTQLYYRIAPVLVNKINRRSDKDEIYNVIRDRYIMPSVKSIKENRLNDAENTYTEMINWVTKRV
jgi:hypothetical protein